ncbi:hypothetical protein GSY74_09575 [Sulfurovum sp. bin170]|uniref:hypothetical protein n=1 Tax=Sulfurovum sp. bin170 TaxID=2695268 RepID=UPI0013DF05C0|nr:hypothetical protein [Sulfurovum sp. bin170]NEW61531.1 hypothetical protein [Sulfurovum sp. bin170]
MKSKLSTLTITLSTLFIVGCSTPAIYTAPNAPVSQIANTPTLAQVDKAVKDSLVGRGWIPQKVSPHIYLGTYNRRELMAKIKITFDTSVFNIQHVESKNLDYDSSDESIHSTYNKWVKNLERDIRKRVDRNVKVDKKRGHIQKKVTSTTHQSQSSGSFSYIQKGMSSKEVVALLGKPNDVTRKVTKKAFNPFYFGSDRFRSTYYYRGLGRIEFNISSHVAEIHHDTSEDGNN